MKCDKYILFAGGRYYPSGGYDDMIGFFETVDDAKVHVMTTEDEWAHIVEIKTWSMVCFGTRFSPWKNEVWEWKEIGNDPT